VLRLTDVRVNQIARDNVRKVLNSGQLAGGRMVAELEQRMAEACGTDYAVAVSSATAGLGLLLTASGVTDEDEVLVPAFTFDATANAVLGVGARVRFADVTDDLLIADTDAEWVIPVHLYGQLADTPKGAIEDAAQAIGQPVKHGVISFYGSKTVGCGEGGMIVTSDPDVALRCRLWRSHGSVETYRPLGFGWNYRMSDLAAAVALGQLETLETTLTLRRRNARILTEKLAGLVKTPGDGTFHQYVIELDDRDAVSRELADVGVESKPIYPYALPDLPQFPNADVPRSREAARRNLALPVHEHLTVSDMAYIADAVKHAIRCVA
jgi:dTDP-4-amino-4,6-dideoxygalactose transaminase